jgi:trehalose utilization protein
MQADPRITVWNEYRHERSEAHIGAIYPEGIHGAIAAGLREHGLTRVRTATLDDPEQGLSAAVLAETDVLTWWGHMAHEEVTWEAIDRVQAAVLRGMGLVVLHSGHYSRIFKRLMGTTCELKWREADERERIWVVEPSHPIADGLGQYFELEAEEMYGERFDVPAPDTLVFLSWFQGGEVFRSGCCYVRGRGKIFYLRPGHETYPTYFNPQVRQVLANAVRWAAPGTSAIPTFGNPAPLEEIVKRKG